MSWSDFTRDQKLVTVFTVLTGLMHVGFAPMWMDDDVLGIKLGILFIVNGIGFFALIYLLYFGDQLKDNQLLVRGLLVLWTVGSIVGWAIYHPDTLLDSSLMNKVVEVLLLVFLYFDYNATAVSD
jgi:hypothetical protein